MSMSIKVATVRLPRAVQNAERDIDQALAATTEVMQTILDIRAGGEVEAHAGQAAITQLLRAQRALIEANNAFLRVHQQLSSDAQVYMAPDEPTCPKKASLTGLPTNTLVA